MGVCEVCRAGYQKSGSENAKLKSLIAKNQSITKPDPDLALGFDQLRFCTSISSPHHFCKSVALQCLFPTIHAHRA